MATFYNQATLSYTGGTVNSNIATGEIMEAISATKTAVVDTYTTESDITYAVNILNSGTTPLTNVTLTDDLGAYTFGTQTLVPLDVVDGSVKVFVNGVLQPDPTVVTEPELTVSGLTVPAGGATTVLYAAQTNEYASPETSGSIQNTATVTAAGFADVTATESVTADAEPQLEIIKSVYPNVVTENGQITYTFEIQNTGSTAADADANIVLTDTFDPILTGITAVYNGTTWVAGTDYTYDAATGAFATETGAITVPAATFTQDPDTGAWQTDPGSVLLTVTGTL